MQIELLIVTPDAEKLIQEKLEVISAIRSFRNLMNKQKELDSFGVG
jgi:hypothetical protein